MIDTKLGRAAVANINDEVLYESMQKAWLGEMAENGSIVVVVVAAAAKAVAAAVRTKRFLGVDKRRTDQ